MGLLNQLKQKYKTLSIVGMAKNAGKTTALNYLIEEAIDEGVVLGITSTGRDGESTDLVTETEKPRVFLDAGTLVSLPVGLYDLADAGLEILKMTNYTTALGQVLLCRVAKSGYVQIAGPVNTADHKALCQEMIDLGAELVLIDGAIDRRSIAAPDSSDAIILATGAVLSRSLKTVVEETVHIVALYTLPLLHDGKTRELILSQGDLNRIMLIKGNEIQTLDLKTGLGASRFLDESIDDETDYIYLPGAFTNSVLADINPQKFKRTQFILKDPTKIFIPAMDWQKLRKKGFQVTVMDNIKIAAITVNPYAPAGYSFEHEALRTAMQRAVEDIPVIDVKMGGDFSEII